MKVIAIIGCRVCPYLMHRKGSGNPVYRPWCKLTGEELPYKTYTSKGSAVAYKITKNYIKNEWNAIRKQIISFGTLQEDWDECGGIPPTPELIDSALEILTREELLGELPPPVRTIPTNEGGIVIEWQFNSVYLEVEICDLYHAEWMYAKPNQQIEHWEESLDWGKSLDKEERQGAASTTIVEIDSAAVIPGYPASCPLEDR